MTVPIVNREIPIIADEYVDREFGTGCVKMTPCHDPNDYEVGLRHGLEQVLVLDNDARVINGGKYNGMDRYDARRAIVGDLEALGWVYSKKDAEGDPGKQVTFIEDAIASGNVGAIMCAAMAVDLLGDVVQKALEAGIIVVYLGANPTDYPISGCVYTSYALTGYYAIEMAEAWAKANSPAADEQGIPVALDVYDDIVDGQYRSNAFRDRTTASDILYVYNTSTSYGDDAQNKGYSWAENMMTANPALRIFVCYEPDCMVGVVSYLNDYCDQNGIDKKEFCVVNCYQDEATFAEYDKALADGSSTVYKGYVTYGDSLEDTGLALSTIIKGAADGSWPFNQIYWDSIHSFPAGFDFVGEWKMGDDNPGEVYQY